MFIQFLSYSGHILNFAKKLFFSELQPYFFNNCFHRSVILIVNSHSELKAMEENKSKHSHSVRPQSRGKVDTFETLGLVRWE